MDTGRLTIHLDNMHTYLLSWDCYGLEACINISDIEKNTVWKTLKGEDTTRDPNLSQIVSMIQLRARYNSQRHYEIYAIDTDDTISVQDIRDMFEENPQSSADLIRDRGRKLYSDRQEDHKIAIR